MSNACSDNSQYLEDQQLLKELDENSIEDAIEEQLESMSENTRQSVSVGVPSKDLFLVMKGMF